MGHSVVRGRAVGSRNVVRPPNVGLEIDPVGGRNSFPDETLDHVDGRSDFRGAQGGRELDLSRNQQLLGTDVLGAEVDHPDHLGSGLHRRPDRLDVLLQGGLPDQQ